MKKHLKKICLLALLAVFSFAAEASAQYTFKVAADSSSGTYAKALGEIVGVCGSGDPLTITAATEVKGGALGNLTALYNNEFRVDAAFLHSDVFSLLSQSDPSYKALKVLATLWLEPVHVIALKQSKTSKGGMLAFGKKVEFNDLADLKGFKVGAAGGGVLTARLILGQGEVGYEVVEFKEGKDVLAALNNGDIAAAIFVGAAPLPNVKSLSGDTHKLLPISDVIANRMKGAYMPATVSYPGLTSAPVRTIAPRAVIMTRKFNTEAKLMPQRQFRECFLSKLDELKDTASRYWQEVDASNRGDDWYEIPAPKVETGKKK